MSREDRTGLAWGWSCERHSGASFIKVMALGVCPSERGVSQGVASWTENGR